MAQHKIKQKSYRDYLSVEEAGKELILDAVSDDAVAPLKKQFIGFGDTTVLQMIDHLRLKTAIRMTTAQKFEYKTNGYNTPWDPTTSITVYFTQLDRFRVSLGDRDERSRKNNGSGRSNMAAQNVYGRSNGRMGKQDVSDANVGGAPNILH